MIGQTVTNVICCFSSKWFSVLGNVVVFWPSAPPYCRDLQFWLLLKSESPVWTFCFTDAWPAVNINFPQPMLGYVTLGVVKHLEKKISNGFIGSVEMVPMVPSTSWPQNNLTLHLLYEESTLLDKTMANVQVGWEELGVQTPERLKRDMKHTVCPSVIPACLIVFWFTWRCHGVCAVCENWLQSEISFTNPAYSCLKNDCWLLKMKKKQNNFL